MPPLVHIEEPIGSYTMYQCSHESYFDLPYAGQSLGSCSQSWQVSYSTMFSTSMINAWFCSFQCCDQQFYRHHCRASTALNRTWPADTENICAELTSENQEISILRTKCAGKFTVPAGRLSPGNTKFSIRPVMQSWVSDLKEDICNTQTPLITRIPVLLDPEQVSDMNEFRPDMVEDTSFIMIVLGGNHVTTAVQELLKEERENEAFASIWDIDIELYVGLNETEAHFIASLHNRKGIQREVTFQEKVKLCHEVYLLYKDSTENWKNVATVSLGYLCGKNISKDSISVVLSTASYNEENFNLVEKMFDTYATRNARSSYPQKLFRSLLSLNEKSRTPYLSRAIGSNGLKESRKVEIDKRKQQLKNLFVQQLDLDNWEEAEELYDDEVIQLMEFADLPTTHKKIPMKVLEFMKKVKEGTSGDTPNIAVNISIKINGVEYNGQRTKTIKSRYCKKIKNEISKIKREEE